jgi:hypothetical protein
MPFGDAFAAAAIPVSKISTSSPRSILVRRLVELDGLVALFVGTCGSMSDDRAAANGLIYALPVFPACTVVVTRICASYRGYRMVVVAA